MTPSRISSTYKYILLNVLLHIYNALHTIASVLVADSVGN